MSLIAVLWLLIFGINKSDAQTIIVQTHLGMVYDVPDSSKDYVFYGRGAFKINTSWDPINGAVTLDGTFLTRSSGLYDNSPLSHLSKLTLRNGGLFLFYYKNSYENIISDFAIIELGGGAMLFSRQSLSYSYERIGAIHLTKGSNQIGLDANTGVAGSMDLYSSGITRFDPKSTLSFYMGYVSNGSHFHIFLDTIPEMLNGIMPYATLRRRRLNLVENHFAYAEGFGGPYEIKPLVSPVYDQVSWNSLTLNVTAESPQTLTANRSVNSLRITGYGDIELGDYTLFVNSGGVLHAASDVSNVISGGNITTSQPRYFFHIYDAEVNNSWKGYKLQVNSVISGSGTDFIKVGTGVLVFGGDKSNAYTGTTYINGGELQLAKDPGATAVRNVVVDGTGREVGHLRLINSHQIDDASTVTLRGAEKSLGDALAWLHLSEGVKETFHALKIEGRAVLAFSFISPTQITALSVNHLLINTDDDFLRIFNWVEHFDYLLVSRTFAPGSDVLGRIHFEGWETGAALRDYDGTHWEIVPYGSPEPGAYGAILGAVGIGLWTWRKRRRKRCSNEGG